MEEFEPSDIDESDDDESDDNNDNSAVCTREVASPDGASSNILT